MNDRYIELPVREPATLMDFLLKQMSGVSRNHVKDLLSGHAVTVDKKLTTRYDAQLEVGQMVQIRRHKQNIELSNRHVKIIYEDKDLVVIEKQPGILSMASAAGQYCVKSVLDDYFTRRHFKCTAHVVHRLDLETSGLMVYAKNIETQQIMEIEWKNIVYDRRYVAVVCGKLEREGGTIHSWLKEGSRGTVRSFQTDPGGAKEATTYFHTLQTTDDYSLVELRLDTGRKNQIRVHLADIGFPVAGDSKYGARRNPIGRLALHAFRLNFYHPRTGQPMTFETPIPLPFQRIVNGS